MVVDERIHTAPTLFLLMTQYNSRIVVQVCRDFFGHLTVEKLLRKALSGESPAHRADRDEPEGPRYVSRSRAPRTEISVSVSTTEGSHISIQPQKGGLSA
jgi:Pyocin activator protein PrtN